MSSADGWRRLIQRKLFWALIAVIAATGCVTAAIAADAPNPAAVPDAAAAQSKTASSESSEKPRTAEAGTMSAGLPASDAPFDTKSLESSINQNISLDLRDMDIVDVLKFLSLKGKFNLAINRSIQGRATLSMKSVSIKNALDIIVKSNGLAYYWVNNILYVLTAEEYVNTYGKKFDDRSAVRIFNLRYAKPSYVLATLDSLKSNLGKVIIDEDTGSVILIDTEENLEKMIAVLKQVDVSVVTTTFKLQYAQAKDIAAQLKQKLDAKSVGSIQADDRSNQVIVTALPDRLVEVEKLIKDLDAPTKGVLIEVRILQITLNPQFDFGINWSNPFAQTGIGFLKDLAVSQVFPISATNIGGTVGSFAYGASSPQELQMAIKALKQVSDTRVIARPRLMVTNNEEANIHIGDTIPYVTSTTTGTGDTATVSEQINFIDVGIKLKVKPTINDEGFVTMKVRPEISSRTKDVTTPQGALIPQVNTTFVETVAMVKDGYTVIIGGLKQVQNTNSTKGLPGMMDMPVAGAFFRNEAKNLMDSEIAIFLTPHIVTGKQNVIDEKNEVLPNQPYTPGSEAGAAKTEIKGVNKKDGNTAIAA